MDAASGFGIAPGQLAKLRAAVAAVPALRRVWIYGSRARGDARPDSDIDLAIETDGDAPAVLADLDARIEAAGLLYRVDTVALGPKLDDRFRAELEAEKRLFWPPAAAAGTGPLPAGVALKAFQADALQSLAGYLAELKRHAAQADAAMQALRAMEGMEDLAREASDYPKKAWAALKAARALPPAHAARAHSSRFDGAGRPIPNVCLKVPTGGGKTLLAAAAVGSVFSRWFGRHTGLVLWVVPNEAIYRQTLKALGNRDHPYRQLLTVAGAGRVKILEKQSPLTRLDTDSQLCVMLLMLQSAARQSKETLRFFRDRGNVHGFVPRDDDIDAHWRLLGEVPNLDVYAGPWQSAAQARAQKGSIVKSSLGNVMRLLRPMVVIDEGHHAYSETALRTIDGFNPGFMLELSATPRVAAARGGSGSNILVDVRGTDLDTAELIKLPIDVEVRPRGDWQSCLAAAVQRLDALQAEADALRAETARYVRPILLVQVERTGSDMRERGFIHAEDARAYLLQLGLKERQIAVKTSERDDLGAPENVDLLAPTCEVRAIITKQALQEGWDCPFAYVLCALAAGRNGAAMTQLVGRILRQPQAAKTGRPALDGCWVLCHDIGTAEVVKRVKAALEGEGMGDLALRVHDGSGEPVSPTRVRQTRRTELRALRLFVPRVVWVEDDGSRRELVYDSDVLARLPWQRLDAGRLADGWLPDRAGAQAAHLRLGLDLLDGQVPGTDAAPAGDEGGLDAARIVRGLVDLAPNPWQVWDWVQQVRSRLQARGIRDGRLARSSASLLERLRVDLEQERDRLAQQVFDELVAAGRIEFRLRADAADYELPHEQFVDTGTEPMPLLRDGLHPMQHSLLVPALRTPDLNEFEAAVAGYLDEQQALRWWHRNVARAQYGLQGWKRHKVYPDFVFAMLTADGRDRFVVVETKGLHLANADTAYKLALLARLSAAFRDERRPSAGELRLEGPGVELVCDLVFDQQWREALQQRHFARD